MFSRRSFIKAGALTGALMPFAGVMASGQLSSEKGSVAGASNNASSASTKGSGPAGTMSGKKSPGRFEINFFTKDLDGFEAAFIIECLAMAGADGLDLVVRN